MRRLSSCLFTLLICVSLMPALQPMAAKEKRITFQLEGRVENAGGEAEAGVRVILLSDTVGSSTPRQTRTDADGYWAFTQVKPGKWKLQALGRDALSEIYQLTISWRKDRHELMPVILKLKIKAVNILTEGKAHVYNHQWLAARKALDFFTANFNESPMLDEVLFWNAYTCFRQARDRQSVAGDLRGRALGMLETLLKKFPAGPWADDARILRLDIWCDQIRSGERRNQEHLLRALDPAHEKDSRVRRAAIEVLISMKPQFAWKALQREFAHTGAARQRGDLLVLIARFHRDQAAPVLERIARDDTDPLVRAGAKYWLQRVNRRHDPESTKIGSRDIP